MPAELVLRKIHHCTFRTQNLDSKFFYPKISIYPAKFPNDFFVTAQTAFHHCTFRFITAHFVHHCTLKQALYACVYVCTNACMRVCIYVCILWGQRCFYISVGLLNGIQLNQRAFWLHSLTSCSHRI